MRLTHPALLADGKLYLATVLDLYSRRLLACPTSEHPDAALACDAIKIAAATRGGRANAEGVIFHTNRGSTSTAAGFTLDDIGLDHGLVVEFRVVGQQMTRSNSRIGASGGRARRWQRELSRVGVRVGDRAARTAAVQRLDHG